MSNENNAYRWAASIRRFGLPGDRGWEGLAGQISADFATDVLQRAVRGTPIKTGHLIYNWQASYFGPSVVELPGVDQTGGLAVIERETVRLQNAKSTQNVFVSNAAPYALSIEARYGMLANAIAQTSATARIVGARGYAKWKARNP